MPRGLRWPVRTEAANPQPGKMSSVLLRLWEHLACKFATVRAKGFLIDPVSHRARN